jgi:hypothetical protein
MVPTGADILAAGVIRIRVVHGLPGEPAPDIRPSPTARHDHMPGAGLPLRNCRDCRFLEVKGKIRLRLSADARSQTANSRVNFFGTAAFRSFT